MFYVRSVGLGEKRELFEEAAVPTATNRAQINGLRSDEMNKLDTIEMICLPTRMDRWRNKGVKCRVDAGKKMSDKVDEKVLKWFERVGCMSGEGFTRRVYAFKVE